MSPMTFFKRTKSFWFGFTLPLTAARVIFRNPKLIFWSLLPIALTLTLYILVLGRLQEAAQQGMAAYLASWGLGAEGWAAWALLLVTRIVLILIGAVTFSLVASIVASPFNDLLAEAAEPYSNPPLSAVAPQDLGHKLRLVGVDLAKTVAAAVATVFALLLSWVPVLNVAAFVLAFLLICFQYVSYPQTRRAVGLGEGLRFLWRHAYACAGFGSWRAGPPAALRRSLR
jgi:CysZ protein